ncbi:MAG: DUF1653 domain-containing protein [Candidatus Diapherotrites archaeon]|nr:DUF1653 domain-containing protein [Candidatus Diapherotrites archaeon]
MKKTKPGVYQHFRGNHYLVLGTGKHSETLEDYVIYQALYGKHELWLRPKKSFLEKIKVKGKKVSRFKKIK